MDVKEHCSAFLSNYEVMKHLQSVKDKKIPKGEQLATITYEALKYLESSACGNQEPEQIQKCLQALRPYNLTKPEKLMIINTPPTTELDIQLIVENSEERLTDDHVNEILSIVAVQMNLPTDSS